MFFQEGGGPAVREPLGIVFLVIWSGEHVGGSSFGVGGSVERGGVSRVFYLGGICFLLGYGSWIWFLGVWGCL